MTAFVLDASVTLRWFFDAGKHEYADAVIHGLMAGTDSALVPNLWHYETSAVLARAQLRNGLAAQEVTEFFRDLRLLPIADDVNSYRCVFPEVHQLAVTHRLTTYDASYLELAIRRRLPLATLDAELIAACSEAGVLPFQPSPIRP